MKEVEIFEDERAQGYDDRIKDMIPNYEYLMYSMPRYLRQEIGSKDNGNVLIAGCGTGNEIKTFKEHDDFWELTGVDPSPDMIGLARKKLSRYNKVKLVVGQVKGLPSSRKFDGATLSLVLHFLPDDGTKLGLLKDIAERLKPGAPFLLIDMFGTMEEVSQNLELFKGMSTGKYDAHAIDLQIQKIKEEIHFVKEDRFLELMEQAGFSRPIRYHQSLIFGGWICKRRN